MYFWLHPAISMVKFPIWRRCRAIKNDLRNGFVHQIHPWNIMSCIIALSDSISHFPYSYWWRSSFIGCVSVARLLSNFQFFVLSIKLDAITRLMSVPSLAKRSRRANAHRYAFTSNRTPFSTFQFYHEQEAKAVMRSCGKTSIWASLKFSRQIVCGTKT